MCCIRVKFELLKLLDIVGYRYCDEYWFMRPSGRFNHRLYIRLFGTGFIQVLYLGIAPRTKETLPDFHEKYRVTRHSRVFCGLAGSQRTPEFGGVIAWYQSLGI